LIFYIAGIKYFKHIVDKIPEIAPNNIAGNGEENIYQHPEIIIPPEKVAHKIWFMLSFPF